MKSTYSEAFVEQAVNKALSRGTRPITEISRELNVPYHTLRKWLGKSSMSKRARDRRPSDWSPENLRAVGSALAKISMVRLRRIEDLDYQRQAISVPARISIGSAASRHAAMCTLLGIEPRASISRP